MGSDIITELRNTLSMLKEGNILSINGLDEKYPAWGLRINNKLGVAIKYKREDKLFAQFSKVYLEYFEELLVAGTTDSYLMLYIMRDEVDNTALRDFATICQSFILPGPSGVARQQIVADPEGWWKRWKDIIGNKTGEKMIHGLWGELYAYRYLLDNGVSPTWTGSSYKRVDFTADDLAVEVKSTLSRYDNTITIHGQYQLFNDGLTPMELYLCKLEENEASGESINDLVKSLVDRGIAKNELEDNLSGLGFREGIKDRKIKFAVLELRSYKVNDSFPQITPGMFKTGKMPDGIVHLDYTIDLSNIPYEDLMAIRK